MCLQCIDLENPIPARSENDIPHNTDYNYHLFTDVGLNRNLFNHINKNINRFKIITLINFGLTNTLIIYMYFHKCYQ